MPGIMMHHHFGQVVYCGLEKEAKEKLSKIELYDFGALGPDAFSKIKYFNKKKNEEYMDMAYIFHTQDTKKYFLNLVEEAKKDYDLYNYLCGQVTHYFLDQLTNPLIYYSCGVYDPSINNTLKYRGAIQKLTQEIDAYAINNYYGLKAEKFNIGKQILKLEKFDESFEEGLNNLYLNAYSLKGGYKLVNLALKYSKKFYRATFDPLGIKNKIFEIFDNGKSKTVYTDLTFKKKSIDIKKNDIFNMNGATWCNPIDELVKSNLSFFDLFDAAKNASIKCINDLYKIVFLHEEVNLDYYFNNASYLTGLDCNKGCEMKHFVNNI